MIFNNVGWQVLRLRHCVFFRCEPVSSHDLIRSSFLLGVPEEPLHAVLPYLQSFFISSSIVYCGLARVSPLSLDLLYRCPLDVFASEVWTFRLAQLVLVNFFHCYSCWFSCSPGRKTEVVETQYVCSHLVSGVCSLHPHHTVPSLQMFFSATDVCL